MNTPERCNLNVLLAGVAAALQAYSFCRKRPFNLGVGHDLSLTRLLAKIATMPTLNGSFSKKLSPRVRAVLLRKSALDSRRERPRMGWPTDIRHARARRHARTHSPYTPPMNSLALGFLARLRLAFAAMIVLVLVQAAIALWSEQTASYHDERSRLAHDMLNQYVELSANKQRLKVWFAQFLLLQDPQTETRDLLLLRIERGLAQLNALASTELLRLRPADSLQTADTNARTLATLGGNLNNLRDKVLNAQPPARSGSVG